MHFKLFATLRYERTTLLLCLWKHGLDKAHINLMISRSGREKPTQTHNHNTRGGLAFLFSAFFAVILSLLMRQPYLEPLPVRERKEGIFLNCIYLWAWEHQSIKEINNGYKREVSGRGDMKLMQLILDYLYYFFALCTLGIPMSAASDTWSRQLHFKPLSQSVCLWLCWNPGGGVLLFHVRLKGWSTRQAMHTGISHEKNCKCAPILRRVKLPVSNTAVIKESF